MATYGSVPTLRWVVCGHNNVLYFPYIVTRMARVKTENECSCSQSIYIGECFIISQQEMCINLAHDPNYACYRGPSCSRHLGN